MPITKKKQKIHKQLLTCWFNNSRHMKYNSLHHINLFHQFCSI